MLEGMGRREMGTMGWGNEVRSGEGSAVSIRVTRVDKGASEQILKTVNIQGRGNYQRITGGRSVPGTAGRGGSRVGRTGDEVRAARGERSRGSRSCGRS